MLHHRSSSEVPVFLLTITVHFYISLRKGLTTIETNMHNSLELLTLTGTWGKLRHSAWKVESLCVDNWTMQLKNKGDSKYMLWNLSNCVISVFFFQTTDQVNYWWVELFLPHRPTVQEDGGDIIFKVCRNLTVFMFALGMMPGS